MLFTYYFLSDTLDLDKFKKQANYYTATISEIAYHLYLPDYLITIEMVRNDNTHGVSLWISEIVRNEEDEIEDNKIIFPLNDNRLKDIKLIEEIFPIDHYKANFTSNKISETIDKICGLTKLMFKINKFKTFI
jgi:hypothetical protein